MDISRRNSSGVDFTQRPNRDFRINLRGGKKMKWEEQGESQKEANVENRILPARSEQIADSRRIPHI